MNIQLVIITGVSGSGKSTALKAFEDLGFSCVDNLPAPLISDFVDYLLKPSAVLGAKAAVGTGPQRQQFALLVDCRDERSFPHVWDAIEKLKEMGIAVDLLFFDCQDEIVVRRFRETRRPHPLLLGTSFLQTIAEALTRERELLADFREAATRVIDTSSFSPHDLRRVVEDYCGREAALEVFLTSFGYKYGVPYDADLLIDVRFLPNPHFVQELQPLTGQDERVREYIFSDPDSKAFVAQYLKLLQFLIPRYQAEGKRYLTIGVGCTGGKHRSVALSIHLGSELKARGIAAAVRHRDLRTGSDD